MGALSRQQIQTIEAIVNIYETGAVLGRYDQVTVLKGDTGGLTYGRSQTTLMSGNLYDLLKHYVDAALDAAQPGLPRFLPACERRDASLNTNVYMHNLLRAAADQKLMRDTQNSFFDHAYWERAEKAWTGLGCKTALGAAIIYDSYIQGYFGPLRDKTTDAIGGLPDKVGEQAWMSQYVKTRKTWLATNPNTLLHKTVYRMDAFQALIAADKWSLALPLEVRGLTIDQAALAAEPPGVYDGPAPGSRTLIAARPWPTGHDVRLLQTALSDPKHGGAEIKADGVYGPGTAGHVKTYQKAQDLTEDGQANGPVFKALGLA